MENRYGCLHFLFDCFMTIITCGFWLIWIFVREMRRKKKQSKPDVVYYVY